MGIKTGDVNLSADVHFGNAAVTRNNNIQWIFKKAFINSENELEIDVQSVTDLNLDGFQVGFILNSDFLSIKEIKSAAIEIPTDEYVSNGQQIKISSALFNKKFIKAGDVLFRIILNGSVSFKEKNAGMQMLETYSNEVYLNEIRHGLEIRNEQDPVVLSGKLLAYPIQPNPFSEEATIRFELPGEGNVNLHIYDLTGKLLLKTDRNGVKGKNEITITRKDFRNNGLMYYVLTTPFGSVSERMFVSE